MSMIENLFEKALHIKEPWYIEEIRFNENEKKLEIKINFKSGATFHYESKQEGINGNYKAYDTIEKRWRHLNFFEHECYLICRTPRIKTEDGKVRLINPPWAGINSGFTMLFEALLIELASNMPIHKVALLTKVSDYKIWNMLDKYIDLARENEDYSEVDTIGMDETSKSKNHDYISLFVDLKKRRTIFIAEGKGSQTVKEFSEDFEKHKGEVTNIKDISCDMSPAFIKGVNERFPNAQITFDKFHILKILNDAVDKVRKEEVKEYEILKKTKYIFLKNRGNLTKKQKAKLEEISISKLNFKTLRAYHIRENFQEIYKAESQTEFEYLLKKWYFWATHSRIKPIIDAAKTIKNHWDGVINWKKSLITNAVLEGLNSVIQAIKAKARGFRTFKNLKIMAYLATGELNFQSINSHYVRY
jgi:transposase